MTSFPAAAKSASVAGRSAGRRSTVTVSSQAHRFLYRVLGDPAGDARGHARSRCCGGSLRTTGILTSVSSVPPWGRVAAPAGWASRPPVRSPSWRGPQRRSSPPVATGSSAHGGDRVHLSQNLHAALRLVIAALPHECPAPPHPRYRRRPRHTAHLRRRVSLPGVRPRRLRPVRRSPWGRRHACMIKRQMDMTPCKAVRNQLVHHRSASAIVSYNATSVLAM